MTRNRKLVAAVLASSALIVAAVHGIATVTDPGPGKHVIEVAK